MTTLCGYHITRNTTASVTGSFLDSARLLPGSSTGSASLSGLGFCACPSLAWGNNWQLYINTATDLELTLVSVFLQNTRQRHMDYLGQCFHSIQDEVQRMEVLLRRPTSSEAHDADSIGDTKANPVVEFHYDYHELTTRGNRIIDSYAAIVGSGLGFVISVVVFSTWIGFGYLMQWSLNWWLIFGTYTGLVGFLDGFVLRNIYFRGSCVVDDEFCRLLAQYNSLARLVGINFPRPISEEPTSSSLQERISDALGYWCSTTTAVVLSCAIIITVLTIASALKWSETGQLICNTPTMIVEGFLLLALIQAHNRTNQRRRMEIKRPDESAKDTFWDLEIDYGGKAASRQCEVERLAPQIFRRDEHLCTRSGRAGKVH
jgi:low-affinity ferrous iron transport protein